MATIMQGKDILPSSVDVKDKTTNQWVMAVDLDNLPPETVVDSIRRNIPMLSGKIYNYVTQYINISTGGVDEVVSRAIAPAEDVVMNSIQTVGRIDSPISFRIVDSTPV